jgi:hypothetical protein
MLEALEEYLWHCGATAIVVPAWKRRQGAVTIAGPLEAAAFRPWDTVSLYWRAACERAEFNCPDRDTACVCDAVFYLKVLAS